MRVMGEGIADLFMRPYNFKVEALLTCIPCESLPTAPSVTMECRLENSIKSSDLKSKSKLILVWPVPVQYSVASSSASLLPHLSSYSRLQDTLRVIKMSR